LVIENWPLIICGDILRRVEIKIASGWIALREESTIKFSIWQGIKDTHPDNDPDNPSTFDSSTAEFQGEAA
jgi:hypothetical protein